MDWRAGAAAFVSAHLAGIGAAAIGSLVCLPAMIVGFGLIERVRPLVRANGGVSSIDLRYFLLSPCFDLLSRLAAALCMFGCATVIGFELRTDLLGGFGPVIRQPSWLIYTEMLLLLELSAYSTHRLFHSVPWLWRFHAIHHSATRLNWLSAVRRHPVNDAVGHCLNATLLFSLGFPINAAMKLLPLVAMHALLTHSNLNMRLGPFARVVVGPIYHRFHHTLPAEGGDKNFAALFPIFDIVFGTYYLPESDPLSLGVSDPDFPTGVLGQLGYPFRSRRTRRSQAGAPVYAERGSNRGTLGATKAISR